MILPPGKIPSAEPPLSEQPTDVQAPSTWRNYLGKVLRFFLLAVVACAASVAGLTVGFYIYFAHDLPSMEKLKDYSPPIVTQFYADNGRLIGEFATEYRFVVPVDQIPQTLKYAFIAAEEKSFPKRHIPSWWEILTFALQRQAPGWCPPILAQTSRTFLITPEKRLRRKIKEQLLAGRIERCFSKEYNLFLYLNQIYLGSSAYGVEAAARTYFGKSVNDLTLAECAMLAGLPQRPSDYSPLINLEKALARREYVLKRMLEDGYITEADYEQANQEEPKIVSSRPTYSSLAPDFVEHVRQYVEQKYGRDALYREGLKVYTTVDLNLTAAAAKAMDLGLRGLDKQQGYDGSSNPDVQGAKAYVRDKSQPDKNPVVRSALIMRENKTGYVRVMLGRPGPDEPGFDRASQVRNSTIVSFEEQVTAFAVYPNSGYCIPPVCVKRIVDRHGKVLEEHEAPALADGSEQADSVLPRAMDEATALTNLNKLKGVVQDGEGKDLKEILGRPDIAGKAGTCNDHAYEWFLGFSPDYTCGVWLGSDEQKSIGNGDTCGRAAATIWGRFMKEVLKGTPVKEFGPVTFRENRSDANSPSTKLQRISHQ